ncbi:MAG: DNA-binding protein [Thermoplasmata archaeon YP2-bin.285]|nr:DNA-binding protein [Candidatus Sysuiplasma superficiale]
MAQRVFAAEFSSSNYEIREGDEKGVVYVVTPLGAKINRIMIAGVITEKEENQGENWKMYTAQVSDPTGTFRISAGQYQENAAKALQSIEPPAYVAAVGKARTFTTEEGAVYVSIRVESIAKIGEKQRDLWIYETCRETLHRIEAVSAAMELSPPTIESLSKLGIRQRYAEGAVLAVQHYGRVDVDSYRGMLVEAMRSIPGIEEKVEEIEQTAPAETEDGDRLTEDEKALLLIIGSLDSNNSRGAEWKEVERIAIEKKLTKERIAEAVGGLLDKGMVYEPVLGKMKRI